MYDPVLKASSIPSLTRRIPHPVDPEKERTSAALASTVGLQSVGVHLCTLAPHTQSSTIHWHEIDEEWFYILSGNAKLVLYDSDSKTETEREVGPGDFIGCKAGTEGKATAHAFRTTAEEMKYLCGGTNNGKRDDKFFWINRTNGDMKWGDSEALSSQPPASA
ncbi:RmlC-like cupin domain-containing protein [Schizophyllum commune]